MKLHGNLSLEIQISVCSFKYILKYNKKCKSSLNLNTVFILLVNRFLNKM